MALLAAFSSAFSSAVPYISLAAAGTQAYSQIQAGKAAKINAESVALQQEKAGKAAQAESQRVALFERKKANYAESRALALAAASGGGVDNPTVQNILGDIKEQGDYNVLASLYSGDTDAELAKLSAGATRRQGRAYQRASYLNAGSTLLAGASSFYGKYNAGRAA